MRSVSDLVQRAIPRKFPLVKPTWPGTLDRPCPKRRIGAGYSADWARRYPARLARAMLVDNVTRPLAHFMAAPVVRGDEVLSLIEGPAIFVSNHQSHADTPLLLSVLPPRFRHKLVVAAAADHFFDRRWKAHFFALSLAAIPIERQRVNRSSGDAAAEVLADGWNLIIYAEGGRSRDGWSQPYRPGAAYLAERTGCPVIPVHVSGTFKILPPEGGRMRRTKTAVIFGRPIVIGPDETRRALNDRIEEAAAALAAESRTDWWTARKLAAEGETVALARGPVASAWRRRWVLESPKESDDGSAMREWASDQR